MCHKIMLIEDDRTMLSLLQTLLTMEGFQVVTARDEQIEQMLTHIVEEKPEVILMDVNLRHGSGMELLSAIRTNPELDDIRVVMSSGMDYKHECLQKGAQGFLMKPYMPDDLIKIVKSYRN